MWWTRHEALLQAVVAGDATAAAEVMWRHIDTSLGAKAASRLSARKLAGAGRLPTDS